MFLKNINWKVFMNFVGVNIDSSCFLFSIEPIGFKDFKELGGFGIGVG